MPAGKPNDTLLVSRAALLGDRELRKIFTERVLRRLPERPSRFPQLVMAVYFGVSAIAVMIGYSLARAGTD